MDDLENRLGAVLGNPEMIEKIMTFAKSLGQSEDTPSQPAPEPASIPDIDLSTLQKLSNLAGQGSIDQNQRTLLNALRPYISSHRISKLERAMRAAKMAGMAGIFLNKPSSGR